MTSDFTPVPSLLGGLLIGAAAALLWLGSGRSAGISGILEGAMLDARGRGFRLLFLAGLLAGGAAVAVIRPAALAPSTAPLPLLVFAGVLVGFGARLGGGCTSGHGVCGIARLSKRSIVATLTFFATAALVVGLR